MELSTAVRLNPQKGLEGPEGKQVPWSPYGRILDARPNFTLDPLFHAGCYYVQDSSAMYVGHIFRRCLSMIGSGRPLRVLDLCAAPGGKTTDLAASLREFCPDGFTLIANEVMKSRVGILSDNAGRWGDPDVYVTSVDPAAFGKLFPGYFDIVVADVPCSGEGMFRKDPRAQAEWSPEVVKLCAERQRRILADMWPCLKEGGFLVYSTCTYEECENDDNLEWAASELGAEMLEPVDEFTDWGVKKTRHGNILRAGEVPGEGQWAGALRKTSAAATGKKCDLQAVRAKRAGDVEAPDPDYALSTAFKGDYPVVDVDLHTALSYLHRDALVLKDAPRGLVVIAYHGHPLGFAKNIGTRCNNLLPQGRRILMDINKI